MSVRSWAVMVPSASFALAAVSAGARSTDSCSAVTRESMFWLMVCLDSSRSAFDAAVGTAELWSTNENESCHAWSASLLLRQMFHE